MRWIRVTRVARQGPSAATTMVLPIRVQGDLDSVAEQDAFIADLAVPRDVEEEVGELDDVYLYTVDDLQGVIRENLKSRRQAARQAQQIIEAEVAQGAVYSFIVVVEPDTGLVTAAEVTMATGMAPWSMV